MTDSPERQPGGRPSAVRMERLFEEQLRVMRKQLELMRMIQGADGSTAVDPVVPLSPVPAVMSESIHPVGQPPSAILLREIPMTDVQRDVWISCQLSQEGSVAYNLTLTLRLTGDLDLLVLQEALRLLVQRHEALRTTFDPTGDHQVVHRHGDAALAIVDLSDGPDQVQAGIETFVDSELTTPFDLEAGPLFRATLLRLGDDDHMLVLSGHHLICDGWSLGLMQQNLGAIYSALLRGEPPQLEDATQFSDYVAWQEVQRYTSEPYWLELYETPPVQLDLPTDHVRPPIRSFAYGSERTVIDERLHAAVGDLARQHGVTTFTVLLAAWEILLHRLSGQGEFSSGVFASGQASMGAGDLVGLCAGLLPLRVQVVPDEPVRDYLVRLRRSAADAFDHQHIGAGQLAAALSMPRDASRPTVVSTSITYETPTEGVDFAGLEAREWNHGRRTFGAFDLEAYLGEADDRVLVDFQYSTSLFEPDTIDRWLGHYVHLLEEMTTRSGATLSQLRLLDDDERNELSTRWNNTRAPIPDRSMVELFERQAARDPERIAIRSTSGLLTFGDLNARANRLARYLRELGIEAERLVGVHLHRSTDMVVTLLAVHKAGGAYVPLDPLFPDERLAMVAQDAGLHVLVTQTSLLESIATEGIGVIALDRDADTIAAHDSSDLGIVIAPSDLAYVIYTSGSTGRPKGVEIQHLALTNFLESMRQRPGLEADDVLLAVTTMSFDIAGLELFLPLIVGATVVLADEEEAVDAIWLRKRLADGDITVMQATPATWQLLLDGGWTSTPGLKVLCGGEALSQELAASLGSRVGSLWNMYGPTETTIWSSVSELHGGGGPVSLGEPIANTELHVLDPNLELQPLGVLGELWLGGAGLARGYRGRDDLTTERFVTHAVGDGVQRRLYRTGDIVRRFADGRIEYIGRADFQVKIRGYRIELGEIETVLARHPSVKECVVAARDGDDGAKRLVAYIVPADDQPSDVSSLRVHLRKTLPDYMVPASFVVLDAFPLTANKKVDRARLPDPGGERPDLSTEMVAPRTETETKLADIWARLLGLERVGIEDNFFDLGGDSLVALRVVMEANRSGLGLAPAAIFRYQSIAQLASAAAGTTDPADVRDVDVVTGPTQLAPVDSVDAAPVEAAGAGTDETPHGSAVRHLALTDVQRDVWVDCQLSQEGSVAYNLTLTLRLTGDLDLLVLQEALRLLVQRHEALRTTFDPTGDHQVVHRHGDAALAIVDLSDGPDQVQAGIETFVDSELTTPFDLEAGPLFRATLLRLGDDDHMLVLSGHHLICDGWSLGLMQQNLGAIYSALLRGEPPQLEDATQFSDYVAWQEVQRYTSEPYWLELYETPPVQLDLPTDHVRPPIRSFAYGSERTVIDERLHAAVGDLARQHGVTTFTVLLAAWEILLHRLSGQGEFSSGVFASGQASMGAGDLVGLCAGLLPLRVQVVPDEPVRDYLVRLMNRAADAFDHQHIGAGQLAAALSMPRDASRPTVVSTSITYETPTEGVDFAGLEAREWNHGRRTFGAFDLEAYLGEADDRVLVDFRYSTSLFEPDTIDRWLGHYVHLLEEMTSRPTGRVSDLRLLEGAEDHERLARWNDTAHPYPDDTVVHAMLDAQAERTPEATALVLGETSVTYAELRDRSNRLAHYLVDRGVHAGVPVGIAMHRSPEMIIGMLAVLKAGGAYLPLDPTYPNDRLAMMVEDAELGLILSGPDVVDFPSTQAEVLDVHAFDGSPYTSSSPEVGTTPDDPMFVTFTSGSTGRPKGVLGTHRGMLNRFHWQWQTYPFSNDEVCCQKTSMNFVDHLWETWGPLLQGHTLILVPDEVVADGARFIDLLAEQRIERLVTVPSLFAALLKAVPDIGSKLSALRYLTLSGEQLTMELAAEVEAVLPGCVLLNLYGMSEASADATWYDQRWGTRSDSFPIGRPIQNMQVYLLDADQRRVPVGDTGEIYVGGVGLAAGYLGRPELTSERFLPNPFVDDPEARMYRSGDLGRWLPDGLLEFVGRVDHQVKVRGIRIELGEIESAIRSLANVEEVVVMAPQISGDRQLVAYVTTAGDDSATASSIRSALAAVLPGYMVPSRIVFLDHIPLTPSGKIDRLALPDPVAERSTTEMVAPRTETETKLADIWARLLGLERVGIEDNFFDLGGDSLVALRVVMEANRSGLGLAPNAILRYQTIADLASAATATSETDEQGIVTGPTPLSPAQLRFLDERRSPDPHHWNVSTLVAADRLSLTSLRAALEALILHHDALRLRLWREDGRWQQEIAAPPDAVPLTSHDFARLTPTEQRAEIERICTELQESFDLEKGILVRAAHFDCGPDAPDRLFVAIHHFAVDGLTWPVFWEDLERAYRQAEAGKRVSLPPKTTSIKAWANQLQQLVQTPAVTDAAATWLQLPWQEVARVPVDFAAEAAANTNASAAVIDIEFGPEETQRLLEGREPLQHVIIAALAACLSDWTGSPTVLIDVLSHGRDAVFDGQNLSRTLGFTLSYNPLVLSDPAWDMTRATVESVSAQIDGTPDGYTFELLRFLSPDPGLRERLTALPRSDVLFNYRVTPPEDDGATTWREVNEPYGPDDSPRGLRQHAIAVRAALTPNLKLVFIYSTALHRAEVVEAKVAEVADAIRRMSMRPVVA